MDIISDLPDDLLLKVLLFLPTKIAVRTSVLSKRWEFLWMWLPKLEYIDNNCSECKGLRRFINLNLPLHKAPIIETLRLKFMNGFGVSIKSEDIRLWVVIVVSRGIRELSLHFHNFIYKPRARLPSSLYTCESLVVLKLTDGITVDVPCMAYLPSLKKLSLHFVTYSNENSLHELLSSCPILEHLVLYYNKDEDEDDHCETLSIVVPSLQRLNLIICKECEFHRLLVNTPSLKCFKVIDRKEYDHYSFECDDMPNLEVAYIDSSDDDIDKFVTSIKYVKRLSLCINNDAGEALYREGIVFGQLQYLKLCSCVSNWPTVLVRFLKDSPNLRELEVDILYEGHSYQTPILSMENQLNAVYLFSSLETFKWTIYGTDEEIDMTKYILRHACCLKIATILFKTPNKLEEVAMVIQELSLSFLGSKTCQLVFG